MRYYIAIDIGTTNCKALKIDGKGNVISSFQQSVISIQHDDGCFEQEPEPIFMSVVELIRKSAGDDTDNIACISFSAAMHSLLTIDSNGNVLSNAMIWADTRSKGIAAKLKTSEEGKKIYEQTGTPIHAMSPLTKIIWLKEERPDIFQNAHKFISIKEYIFFRLTGRFLIDEGIASCTGLYDIYKHSWCPASLEAAGIDESKLSEVVAATHSENVLSEAVKTRYPFLAGHSFVCGGNDGCLANLGCGALNEKQAALTVGTSGAIRVTENRPRKTRLNPLFRYLLTESIYVTGGPVNNGGIVIDWFATNFLGIKIDSNESFEAVMNKAAESEAGSNGVYFLPYLLGERAPVWDANASGLFYGLKITHERSNLTRAVIEGISFNLMQILESIENTGKKIDEIIATGIVTKSDWWMQLLADMFGKKVILNESADASAMGAAIVGMKAVGDIKRFEEITATFRITRSFSPDKKTHEHYRKLYVTYKTLYPRMTNANTSGR